MMSSSTRVTMKGKGKGKESTDSNDICPLGFLDFTPIDHTRICQKYTSILQRSESDGVSQDDLDALQLELETLLVSVTKRGRELDQEMQILVSWQEKKEKASGKITDMGKRSRLVHGKPKKRFKDGSGKAHPLPVGRPKSKNIQQNKLQEYEFNDSPLDVPRQQVPKNDAPNRFWASLEPYCAEITQEDLKVLDDILKSHDEDADYFKVPALGKHFSIKWAQEDLLEEQKEGSRLNEKRRGLSNNSSLNFSESDRLLKKVSDKVRDAEDTPPFGSLTQRLVSCLIEENLVASIDDTIDGHIKDELVEGSTPSSKANFIKSLSISNAVTLEKRIRRELEEQGILDVDEVTNENSSGDEILAELNKCQAELKMISASNISQTKKLFRLAKEEVAKQEIRKRLQLADSEVMEIYRRIVAARQKKRSPSKKEREQAWKALKDREHIIKQIDGGQYA